MAIVMAKTTIINGNGNGNDIDNDNGNCFKN